MDFDETRGLFIGLLEDDALLVSIILNYDEVDEEHVLKDVLPEVYLLCFNVELSLLSFFCVYF